MCLYKYQISSLGFQVLLRERRSHCLLGAKTIHGQEARRKEGTHPKNHRAQSTQSFFDINFLSASRRCRGRWIIGEVFRSIFQRYKIFGREREEHASNSFPGFHHPPKRGRSREDDGRDSLDECICCVRVNAGALPPRRQPAVCWPSTPVVPSGPSSEMVRSSASHRCLLCSLLAR